MRNIRSNIATKVNITVIKIDQTAYRYDNWAIIDSCDGKTRAELIKKYSNLYYATVFKITYFFNKLNVHLDNCLWKIYLKQ